MVQTVEADRAQERSAGYQVFMLALCVFALLGLAVDRFLTLSSDLQRLIQYADFTVCLLFLADFVYSLAVSKSRMRYLLTWGWIDLLSSIPAVNVFRLGRAARILRVFRVLRGAKATRVLSSALLEHRAQNAFLSAALVSLLLLVVAGAAIMTFEDVPEANIKGVQDAIWWAFVTMTSVGYGDRFPVTAEGRLVGALLMTAGVGLFGTFSGFVASWFLAPQNKQSQTELELLRQEVAALRQAVERRV